MRTFGADVSRWEGDINWLQGVDYLPFVYYKATDGLTWIDEQFLGNKAECSMTGMPHAPYHWWQETQDPIAQAEHFVETVMPGYKQLIVDVEPKVQTGKMMSDLNKLMDRIYDLTHIVASIYTSANYWDSFMQSPYPNAHPLLVAQYAYRSQPKLPNGATNWKFWQFTDQFWFWGCNATADGNWFNGTLEECREWFGNYFSYQTPPQPPMQEFLMKSIYDGLYVRKGPGTGYAVVSHLNKDDVVSIKDVSGTSAWIQIKDGPHAGMWCAASTYKRFMLPV